MLVRVTPLSRLQERDETEKNMTDLTVREVAQSEWDHWDEWLARQSWGSPFSAAWWLDANCRAFGGRPLILGVFDGGELTGGVTLRITDVGPVHAVRSSILYNPIVISAESALSRQKILGALLDEIARQRLVVPPLTCTTDMVDLRQAVWHHWNVIASWTVISALRTWTPEKDVTRGELKQVRKAQRFEVTAHNEPPDPDILFDLMRATMSRQGQGVSLTRVQLRTLIEAAGTHGTQTVVRDADGIPLSTGFVMAHTPRVAYAIWNGTSRTGLAKGAAVALDLFRLNDLGARGYEYLDWCGANLPGVSDFKLKFGGTLTTRLAISREPLWFKVTFPAYARLSQLRWRYQR